MKRKIKIAIDSRTKDPRQGAGMSFQALAHGLSRLQRDDQEYVLIVPEGNVDFFRPYISGSCSLVGIPEVSGKLFPHLKAVGQKIPFLHQLWVASHPGDTLLPVSDGTAERLGCDVVHFPTQTAYRTEIPSIYQPWDLQHSHYPEFFTAAELRLRNVFYPGFCRLADSVCVQTEWTKHDVETRLGVAPEKISVIPWGTSLEAHEPLSASELNKIKQELQLPESFFLYPAVTWPHKNHEQILRSIALRRERTGVDTHVVFTGASTPYKDELVRLAKELRVSNLIKFAGFVTKQQLQALYQMATALLFPSKFEGLGMPILEAFLTGLPVICSSATVLPEVTRGAALLVDPNSPKLLADAIDRVLTDSLLRKDLIEKGRNVLPFYSVDDMALRFSELYDSIARKRPRTA